MGDTPSAPHGCWGGARFTANATFLPLSGSTEVSCPCSLAGRAPPAISCTNSRHSTIRARRTSTSCSGGTFAPLRETMLRPGRSSSYTRIWSDLPHSAWSGRHSLYLPLVWSHVVAISTGIELLSSTERLRDNRRRSTRPGDAWLADALQTTWLAGGLVPIEPSLPSWLSFVPSVRYGDGNDDDDGE
jgi:hypothetical protein